MIRSGFEICQPSVKWRGWGKSRGSPCGAPSATQSAINCLSPSLSRLSLAKCPNFGSACQGGMRFSRTTSSIIGAQPTTSS